MTIHEVHVFPLAYEEPNDLGAERYICLAKITTKDGLVGWGEATTQFPEANLATARLIESMSQSLIGADPVHTAALWHRLKHRAWWYGYGGGLASNAVAALDIALWDLKGKVLGRSVLDLLGGPVHERLPAIASCHAHHADLAENAEEARRWLSTGLHGIKVGFGKRGDADLGSDHRRDVDYVAQMREAIGDKMLMIDLGITVTWDVATAIRRTQAFEELGIDWIEEPLGAWDPAGYRRLANHVRTPIAYGEKEWAVEGYDRILETATCDVVGVDPGRAEGITGFKRVADRVEACKRQVNAHAWSSAIVTAASLAVSFSTPAAKVFEMKPSRNPMQHDLVTAPFEHRDGWVHPPSGPGLGVDVREDVVAAYRQT